MKIQVCAGGFLMKKNKLLFGKRSPKKTWAPKKWDIVGGRSLKGEHPLETLKRETFEEIGVNVLSARLIKSLDVVDESKNGYFKYHIYMITSWRGQPSNCCDEHTKIKWFTKEQLSKEKIALNEYLTLLDDWFDDGTIVE